MTFNIERMFDEPEYSDVVVFYSGRKTFCHKIILCQSSDYFKKLCGPGSQFAESKQDIIELHEDDPDAVYQLLRFVYNDDYIDEYRCGFDESLVLQLSVAKVAQKYLYPDLYNIAYDMLVDLVVNLSGPAEIFEAIIQIRSLSHDEKFLEQASKLEDTHAALLWTVPAFRERLGRDKAMMWRYLHTFAEFQNDLVEKTLMWCPKCGESEIEDAPCSDVHAYVHEQGNRGHKVQKMRCWVQKDTPEPLFKSFNSFESYSR